MLNGPALEIVCALIGLFAGTVIVFAAPRLVAYRLEEPPPFPPWPVLIPVAGALLARWRPVRAVGCQIITALAFEALAVHYGESRRLVLAMAYSALLLLIAYIDLDHRLVLNILSYPGIALTLAGSIFWPGLGLGSAALGAVTALVIFMVLQVVGRGALGTGDTKLAVLLGAMRGFPTVFNTLLLGVLLGGLGAAFALFVLRRSRKDYIAYAPYLAVGGILSFFLTSP